MSESLSAAGRVLWHLADNQGTVRDLVDNDGDIVNHLVYDAWGQLTGVVDDQGDPATLATRYTYTGRELDPETGLYYHRHRWYDPATGSWISEDWVHDDYNRTRFLRNSPTNYIDPDGFAPIHIGDTSPGASGGDFGVAGAPPSGPSPYVTTPPGPFRASDASILPPLDGNSFAGADPLNISELVAPPPVSFSPFADQEEFAAYFQEWFKTYDPDAPDPGRTVICPVEPSTFDLAVDAAMTVAGAKILQFGGWAFGYAAAPATRMAGSIAAKVSVKPVVKWTTDSLAKGGAYVKSLLSFSTRHADDICPPGTATRGGPYGKVRSANQGGQVHHTPAAKVTPYEYRKAPSIWMESADHRKTASWGRSKAAQEYRAKQDALINQGKLREAIQMDIDDIRSKFGSKYDANIKQMLESFGFSQ